MLPQSSDAGPPVATPVAPPPATATATVLEALLEHRQTVFLICLGFTRHRWDAEDLTQETYVRAQERLEQLRDPGLARAWLSRIARNACLDHLRRARWRRLLVRDEAPDLAGPETPATLIEEQEQRAALKRAIEALPRRLRDVFVLRAYGELSYEEVARALDLRLGTVMSRLHRARAILARKMEGVL